MAKKSEATLFQRFIIMLMGLGVALVGAYPLTKESGGVLKYLKNKGIAVGGIENYVNTASKRARLKYNEITRESSNSKKSNVKSNVKAVEKPKDILDNSDRDDLNKLLEEVGG